MINKIKSQGVFVYSETAENSHSICLFQIWTLDYFEKEYSGFQFKRQLLCIASE